MLVDIVAVSAQGGVLITIQGTYFKDRGVVTASNGIDTLTCETPPLGDVGEENDLYYKHDGTKIQVRGVVMRF